MCKCSDFPVPHTELIFNQRQLLFRTAYGSLCTFTLSSSGKVPTVSSFYLCISSRYGLSALAQAPPSLWLPLKGTSAVGQGNSPAPHCRNTDTYWSWQSRCHGMKSETTGSVGSNTQSVCCLLSPVRRPTKSQPFNSNCFVTQHQPSPSKKTERKRAKKSSVVQLLASEKRILLNRHVEEDPVQCWITQFHKGENSNIRHLSELRLTKQQEHCNAYWYSHDQQERDRLLLSVTLLNNNTCWIQLRTQQKETQCDKICWAIKAIKPCVNASLQTSASVAQ